MYTLLKIINTFFIKDLNISNYVLIFLGQEKNVFLKRIRKNDCEEKEGMNLLRFKSVIANPFKFARSHRNDPFIVFIILKSLKKLHGIYDSFFIAKISVI